MSDMVFPKMLVDNGSTSSNCYFHSANAKDLTISLRTTPYKLHEMNGCFQLFSARLTFSQLFPFVNNTDLFYSAAVFSRLFHMPTGDFPSAGFLFINKKPDTSAMPQFASLKEGDLTSTSMFS